MRLFLSLTASMFALSALPAAAETVTPIRVADAVDTIGVNTHLNYLDTSYANVQQVVAAMKYIGVYHSRDASPSPWNPGSGPLNYYVYAMQNGIKFDFIAHCCQAGFGTDVGQTVDLLKQVPGGVVALEGFNEVDMNPVTWMGQTGPAAAVAAQKNLYASVKGNATLKSLAVYDVTGVEHDLPTSLSGRADFANAHLYPQNGNQPNFWFKEMAGFANSKKEPLVVTEFGYASYPEAGWQMIGVDEVGQAKGILNGVFSGIEQGVKRTYLYELLDQKTDPQNKQREWHFGLFTVNYQPKASARALAGATALMADTSTRARTFAVHPLTFTVSGLPATGHKVVMERSLGAQYIWLWNEAAIWDRATGKPVSSPPVKVTVALTGAVAQALYDPMYSSSKAVQTFAANAGTVTIDVPDHPVVIKVARTQ
jgi:hypothetical protein